MNALILILDAATEQEPDYDVVGYTPCVGDECGLWLCLGVATSRQFAFRAWGRHMDTPAPRPMCRSCAGLYAPQASFVIYGVDDGSRPGWFDDERDQRAEAAVPAALGAGAGEPAGRTHPMDPAVAVTAAESPAVGR